MPKKLNEISNLPQMTETITGWFYPITLIKLENRIVDHVLRQIETYIKSKGVIQPLTEQAIEMKPEEQRAWAWYQMHLDFKTIMKVGEQFIYDNQKYRVMARKNYKLYGYMEYHIIEEFIEVGK